MTERTKTKSLLCLHWYWYFWSLHVIVCTYDQWIPSNHPERIVSVLVLFVFEVHVVPWLDEFCRLSRECGKRRIYDDRVDDGVDCYSLYFGSCSC